MVSSPEHRPTGEGQPIVHERDGTNPIERKAVYRAQLEIRSMPASLVVQIALWPDKLADWAKQNGIAPAVVYNMLAGVKPYHRVRGMLARRLNVPKSVLDHLVDAPRPEALARVPPDPPVSDDLPSGGTVEPGAGQSLRDRSEVAGAEPRRRGTASARPRRRQVMASDSPPQIALNL